MVPREKYLKDIALFQNKDIIKVITGIRRCGKSTMLDLCKERLRCFRTRTRTPAPCSSLKIVK